MAAIPSRPQYVKKTFRLQEDYQVCTSSWTGLWGLDYTFRCKRCVGLVRQVDGRKASSAMQWQRCDPLDTGVTTKDQVFSQALLDTMQLDNLGKVLCTRRQRWNWHFGRIDGWLIIQRLNPTGGWSLGLPKGTWSEMILGHCLIVELTEAHPSDRKNLERYT